MQCPHCTNIIYFRHLVAQSFPYFSNNLKDELRNLILLQPMNDKKLSDDELTCPSCSKRIYFGYSCFVLFFGSLIALYVLSQIDTLLLREGPIFVPAYIFISVVLLFFYSLRLQINPGIFILIRRDKRYSFHFIISYFLFSSLLVQICLWYTNWVPSMKSLTKVSGTIEHIQRNKNGFPRYLSLYEEGAQKKYYFTFDSNFQKKWFHASKLDANQEIHLLVSESISVTEDSYQTWEITQNSEPLIPYEAVRIERKASAVSENRLSVKITGALLLCYLISSRFKKKADLSQNINP